MDQETDVPVMKLQSMVYQLMRLCEKLEAGGDRGIQRDLELRATVESLNKTIIKLNQVGPLLENSVRETTHITANKIHNNLLVEIKKAIDQQILEVCHKLRTECNRAEIIVNHNEKLIEKNFLLYIVSAMLFGIICGAFIMFKWLT